jgi:hypothetical protein
LAFCGILCDLSETASRPWWLVESFWTTNHAAMRSATKPLQSCGPRLAISALGVGDSQTLTPVTRLFPVLGCRTYGFTYAIYAKKGVYTGIYGVYTLYMRSHIRLLPNPTVRAEVLKFSFKLNTVPVKCLRSPPKVSGRARQGVRYIITLRYPASPGYKVAISLRYCPTKNVFTHAANCQISRLSELPRSED